MTGATICSGIGAPEAAMPWVDWKWCAEIEKFPSSVLARRHPSSVNLGDVMEPDFMERAAAFGAMDILVAGTPCQAFSVAGNRKSLDDERGNLTLRLVEITHAIKPGSLLWENVPGVLSTHDNAFGCFLAGLVGADAPLHTGPGRFPAKHFSEQDGVEIDLPIRWPDAGVADGPLGSAAWRILDAQYFGLAQRRKRVFLIFCPRTAGVHPAEILFEFQGMRRDSPPSREAWQRTAGTLSSRTSGGGGLGTDFDLDGGCVAIPILEPGARTGKSTNDVRCGDGIGEPGDPMFTLQSGKQHGVFASTGNLSHCLNAGGMGRIDYETETLIAHALRADGFDASEDGTGRGTPLVPAYALAIRGREGTPQIEMGDEVANAVLTPNGGRGGIGVGATLQGLAVRRLTPRECERLQGFPDDYTLLSDKTADGPRYKALGNSMAVPVVAWIGRRIAVALYPEALQEAA